MTPLYKQYLEVKKECGDALVMYRIGDFYEFFAEDAKLISKVLDLTLTSRDCGIGERVPMCGIPYSRADIYIATLVAKGYKVAVCEQGVT